MEYKILVRESEDKTGYGIYLDDGGTMIDCIPEIAENKAKIEQLANLLNELKIESCHFNDIVEDFLTDFNVY